MRLLPAVQDDNDLAPGTLEHVGQIFRGADDERAAGAPPVQTQAPLRSLPSNNDEMEQTLDPSGERARRLWGEVQSAVRPGYSEQNSQARNDWLQVLDAQGLTQQLQHVRGVWGRTLQEASSAAARIYPPPADRRIGGSPARTVHDERPPLILSSRPSPLQSPGHVSPPAALAASPIDEIDEEEASIFQQLSDLQAEDRELEDLRRTLRASISTAPQSISIDIEPRADVLEYALMQALARQIVDALRHTAVRLWRRKTPKRHRLIVLRAQQKMRFGMALKTWASWCERCHRARQLRNIMRKVKPHHLVHSSLHTLTLHGPLPLPVPLAFSSHLSHQRPMTPLHLPPSSSFTTTTTTSPPCNIT